MKIDSNELRSFLKDNACAIGKEDCLLYANPDTCRWEDAIGVLEKREEMRVKVHKHNRLLYIISIVALLISIASTLRMETTNDIVSFIVSVISGLYLIFFMLLNYK